MRKKLSNKQLGKILYEITEDVKGENRIKAVEEFMKLLVRIRKVTKAANIIEEFEKYSKKKSGVVEIEVQSARNLDERTLTNIKKVFGEKVEVVESVDEKILGGIKVKTEDKILDASLKTQLKQLKQFLA